MNALIGMEFSQTITKAFLDKGANAYSCDLIAPTGDIPGRHLQMDIYEALNYKKWDLVILHPDCKTLAYSGNSTYGRQKKRYPERAKAMVWTLNLWNYCIDNFEMVCMENPLSALLELPKLPRPQIVQPYYFGDEYKKTTCLYLHNLPRLLHNDKPNLFTDIVTHVPPGEMSKSKNGKIIPTWYSKAKNKCDTKRRQIRSKTFNGIALAMADQWFLTD